MLKYLLGEDGGEKGTCATHGYNNLIRSKITHVGFVQSLSMRMMRGFSAPGELR